MPPSTSIKVKSFPGEVKTKKHYPEGFLTYFVPCVGIDQGPGRATFLGVGNCFATGNFPANINLLACFAIHPEPGKHQVTIRYGSDQDHMQPVYEDNIETDYPLQEMRYNPQVSLYVPCAGDYFLELWLDAYRLARKPFVVADVIPEMKASVAPDQEIIRKQKAALMEHQMTRADPELASGETILSFMVPCGRAEIREIEILFDGIGSVVFPPKFPAKMRHNLVIGFRVKPGTYRLRAELIESATRVVMPVFTTVIEALHQFREVQSQGDIVLSFPRQGIYVLDVYLNESRIARSHFVADNVNAPIFYKLRQQEIDRIKGGETLMVVRDSIQESEPTPS